MSKQAGSHQRLVEKILLTTIMQFKIRKPIEECTNLENERNRSKIEGPGVKKQNKTNRVRHMQITILKARFILKGHST